MVDAKSPHPASPAHPCHLAEIRSGGRRASRTAGSRTQCARFLSVDAVETGEGQFQPPYGLRRCAALRRATSPFDELRPTVQTPATLSGLTAAAPFSLPATDVPVLAALSPLLRRHHGKLPSPNAPFPVWLQRGVGGFRRISFA
jgi:hypothetical protein